MKICTKCESALPLESFGPRRGVAHANTVCRSCWAAYYREYYKKEGRAEKVNRTARAKRYGITIEEVIAYEGKDCEICGKTGKHIDHCHTSGKVRGILCHNCNTAIGLLGDNPDLFEKAILYLRQKA